MPDAITMTEKLHARADNKLAEKVDKFCTAFEIALSEVNGVSWSNKLKLDEYDTIGTAMKKLRAHFITMGTDAFRAREVQEFIDKVERLEDEMGELKESLT